MAAVRLTYPEIPSMEEEAAQEESNTSILSSKIFPPTPGDLPTKENPAESGAKDEASAVSTDTTASEPQTKKLKPSTEDLGNDDWETVEKPNEAISDEATDVSGKVQAGKLGGSDGEEIEKPVEEKQKGESKASAVQPENMLAKDW